MCKLQPTSKEQQRTHTMKKFTSKAPTSSARPDLAVRLRNAAAIFTRAALMLHTNAQVVVFLSHHGTRHFIPSRNLSLGELIEHAGGTLANKVGSLSVFLLAGVKTGDPAAPRLIASAARKCREWADFEESVMVWATPEPAPRKPAHYVPFHRNGAWIYTMPYGISDKFTAYGLAKTYADLTREEDELARETAERLRQPEVSPQEVTA